MTDEGLTLQQIAQRAVDRNGGAAGRALDRAAKKAGLTLSYTTVDKILAGTYRSRPKQATLDALAQLAGLPRETVYRAADRPLPQAPFADQLPPDADTLTPAQRDAVLAVIRQFAAANASSSDSLSWADRERVLRLVDEEYEDSNLTALRSIEGDPIAVGPLEGVDVLIPISMGGFEAWQLKQTLRVLKNARSEGAIDPSTFLLQVCAALEVNGVAMPGQLRSIRNELAHGYTTPDNPVVIAAEQILREAVDQALSVDDDSVRDLVAADEQETSISGEQEQPTEP